MDLLGSYSSDSDSGSDENKTSEFSMAAAPGATAATVMTLEPNTRAKSLSRDPKSSPLTSKILETTNEDDKKKRVIGKKLLKLSAVLPEYILNQLHLSGGGGLKENNNRDSDSDSSVDNEDEKPFSQSKTTASTAKSSDSYSIDEGITGLLSELSKTRSTRPLKNQSATKILGNDELIQSSKGAKVSDAITSEPLGAAFLTTTIETTKRTRKEPTKVRSIHENLHESKIGALPKDSESYETGHHTKLQRATSTNVSNHSTSITRPSTSGNAPLIRAKATSSMRSAAPPVSIQSTHSVYTPVVSRHSTDVNGYEEIYDLEHQDNKKVNPSSFKTTSKKKKQLSRKRQMEQMLRSGKLNEVQGDLELEGGSHVYQHGGDNVSFSMSKISDSAGVRVVPTGSYNASTGATAMSTDVTSRQKHSNQLNSLLANAASLESHRAQNPQFFLNGKGKGGSHRATAKRKYGW